MGARARRYSGHDRAGPSKNAMKAKMFGEHDEATVKQIETCIEAGGERGVLCADGHKGYALALLVEAYLCLPRTVTARQQRLKNTGIAEAEELLVDSNEVDSVTAARGS